MGLMQKLMRRFKSVKEQLNRLEVKDDSGDLISDTADFLIDARKELYAIVLDMTVETLMSKMEVILELDMMIKAGRDLVAPLEHKANLDCNSQPASKRAARAYLDLLRTIAIHCYFYIDFLKRNDGEIDRKFFRKLKEKGLVKLQDSEFVRLNQHADETYPSNPISEAKFARVLELRDMAAMEMEPSRAFRAKIKHKVRFASNRMKGLVCVPDLTRSQSDTPRHQGAREKGDGLIRSSSSKLSDSDSVHTEKDAGNQPGQTDQKHQEHTTALAVDSPV